ncbi:hypothetical protein AZO1586R_2359 [Bathymodiolus azoricus thioautotrophic gill symbiont]|uniref:Uncharacterized protein n=1 Tax=Bathymodiolus azoricus thioautotrophic gill symbiont TaxID=235205 RepID=A0ACA8ZU87_9GAMM|nr:hypothetical protein AZO1586R_2359 [Bathymodiolus azoricus thioautotrophic gill symbiont]
MAELPQASSSFLLIGSSIARLNLPAASLSDEQLCNKIALSTVVINIILVFIFFI